MKGWKSIEIQNKNTQKFSEKKSSRDLKPYFGGTPKQKKKTYFETSGFSPSLTKKLEFFLLFGVLLVGNATITFASDKINSVKVKFSSEEKDEHGIPVIEAESDNEKYSVDDVVMLEEYEEGWTEDDDDNEKEDNSDLLAWNATYLAMQDYSKVVYAVELECSDEYYFLKDMSKLKLSGLGAEAVRVERLNDRQTLVMFVRFSDLNNQANAIEEVGWTKEGRGVWTKGVDSLWYELRFYVGGRLSGEKRVTGNNSYDFRPLMQEADSYYYIVRQMSSSGKAGEWKQSDTFTVTVEQAEKNQELFAVKTERVGDTTSPSAEINYLNTGWQKIEDGRFWYREIDGSYPQQSWINQDGVWYFFDADGYLLTENYVKWGENVYYVDQDGHMLTSGKSPDGRLVQPDGTLEWPES